MVGPVNYWRDCEIPIEDDEVYMDSLEKELYMHVIGDDDVYPPQTLITESLRLIKALRSKIDHLEKFIKALPND